MHHGRISKHYLVVVYTKYEVNRSILDGDMPIQQISPHNPVFEMLTKGHSAMLHWYNRDYKT